MVGLRTRFYSVDSDKNNVGEQLPPLWAAFLPRLNEIEHRVPPTDTGFDWGQWSTGSAAWKKNLELIQPGGTVE